VLVVHPQRSIAPKQQHQCAINTWVPGWISGISTYIGRVDIRRFGQLRIDRKWSWSSGTVYVMVPGRAGGPSTPL
jgi:hypothetical protein